MKIAIPFATIVLIVVACMALMDLQDPPAADIAGNTSMRSAPAEPFDKKSAAKPATRLAPSVSRAPTNVTYEHQRPVAELDARTREYLSNLTSDVLSDLAARMRSSKDAQDSPRPGQVIPQRIAARLDAEGVLAIELGRGFIPPHASSDELLEQLGWFERTAQEFLMTEVELKEVKLLFDGETLDFYFPNDPGLGPH